MMLSRLAFLLMGMFVFEGQIAASECGRSLSRVSRLLWIDTLPHLTEFKIAAINSIKKDPEVIKQELFKTAEELTQIADAHPSDTTALRWVSRGHWHLLKLFLSHRLDVQPNDLHPLLKMILSARHELEFLYFIRNEIAFLRPPREDLPKANFLAEKNKQTELLLKIVDQCSDNQVCLNLAKEIRHFAAPRDASMSFKTSG